MDILLKFMRILPEDRSAGHLKIAKTYAYSGVLLIDFVATFPFNLTPMPRQLASVFKLLRLTKLPLVFRVLQYDRFKPVIDFFWQAKNRKRAEVVQLRISCTSYFQVIRLIVGTSMVVYFGACLWYVVSEKQPESILKTFITVHLKNYDCSMTNEKLIATMYFIMTTISTVGYGDKFAESTYEKIAGILLMLTGTGIFAVVLGIFGSIIEGSTDEENEQ